MNNYLSLLASDYKKYILDEVECIVVVIFNSEEFASNLVYDSIIQKLSNDFCDFCKFYKFDAQKNQSILKSLEIDKIPSVLIYQYGEIQDVILGVQPKKFIESRIKKLLDL